MKKRNNPGCPCCSSSGHTLTGCPCTSIPGTLYMHVASQPNPALNSLVFPATLAWQAQPPELANYVSDPFGYYSTTTFNDRFGLFKYYYWFSCASGVGYFVAGLMTPDSPVGGPGRFQIMSWTPGFPGNTCSPFSMHNGTSNSSTFQAQGITIDATGPA